MRPTNLGFKSPREVCQAPQYNPTVTAKGKKLTYAPTQSRQTKQRPKSNLSSRFCDSHRSNMSVFLGPGRYNDENKTILQTVKSKISAKYKGDVIDSRASPYTYAGDVKVLDLAFLSPQARKAAFPYVITTSINLASPKINTPISVGSNYSTAYSTAQQTKGSLHNINANLKSQASHNRTKSLQVADGIKAPWEKILNNIGHFPGDQAQKTSGEYSRKGSIELTKAQKQRNDQIYCQLVDSQLSNDLKSLKQELESFQKKKMFKDFQVYDTKQNWSTTDGTNTRKATETDRADSQKGTEEERGDLDHKKTGKGFIQIQEEVQVEEEHKPDQEQLGPESRVLVETSSNNSNAKGPDVSFDGDGFITMNIASPKFGNNDFKAKQKEMSNIVEQKSMNKAIELKRKAMVTLTSNSSIHSISYHSRSGSMTSKTIRKL